MARKPVYVDRNLPSPYELTKDEWLRQEPRDSRPNIESFGEGREFRMMCSQCREYVLKSFEQEPVRTIYLWQRLSQFKRVRSYVLDDLLTEGKIVVAANGVFYYTKNPKYWYYLTRKLPSDMLTKTVPYKPPQQNDT